MNRGDDDHIHNKALQRTIDSYNKYADAFLKKHGDFEPIEPVLLMQKYKTGNLKILDVGCGLGRDVQYLIRHGYPATIGLDLSYGMLTTGQKSGGFSYSAVLGDFRDLPFENGQFDVLWAAVSLIHIPRSQMPQTLLEFQRVLCNKGLLYFNLIRGEGETGEESPPGELSAVGDILFITRKMKSEN